MLRIIKKSNNYPDSFNQKQFDDYYAPSEGNVHFHVDVDAEDSENGVSYRAVISAQRDDHGLLLDTVEIDDIIPLEKDSTGTGWLDGPDITDIKMWCQQHKNSIIMSGDMAEAEAETDIE